MLGEIASAAKLAAAAAQGFAALRRLQPEYAKFWKKFEAELKPEARDLPWGRLRALRIDPEFVGAACGYIRGDRDCRKRLRSEIARLADPPTGGRYDADEIVERVMRAADESAVVAARDDRDVTAQRGRLLEGRIDEVEENLSRQLRELQEAMSTLQPQPPLQPKSRFRAAHEISDSEAELELSKLLDRDPTVQAWAQQAWFEEAGRRYQPDFVVRDRHGVNWFVELKGGHLVAGGKVQQHLRRLANLVERAAVDVSADWRFVLVTPANVHVAGSWDDLLAEAETFSEPPGHQPR